MPKAKNVNDSIAIYIAKILFAILILLAFFMTYLIILSRDTQSYNNGTRKLRAIPNSTSYFLSNSYQQGAKAFEIQGDDGTFLGTDRTASVLAVNIRQQDDKKSDPKKLLQVFDIKTQAKRVEIPLEGCSNVSHNNIVYCHNGADKKLVAVNILNGKTVADFPATDRPTQIQLLGSQQDTDILQITASDTDDNKGKSELMAVTGSQVRWNESTNNKEQCGVIDKGRTIVCQSPKSDAPDTTKIRTIRSQDGNEIGTRETTAQIALTSDGWMEKSPEQEASSPTTTAAFTSHLSIKKTNAAPLPEPNKIFGVDAKEKGTTQNWGESTFYPNETGDKALNTETLAYPSHVIEAMKHNAGGIVTADGEINLIRVPSHNANDYSFAHLGGPEIVFSISAADKILSTSKNGLLVLLKLDNSANKNNSLFTLYDTQLGTTVLDIEDEGNDELTVINGHIAVTKKAQTTGKFEKLVIYLPEGQ